MARELPDTRELALFENALQPYESERAQVQDDELLEFLSYRGLMLLENLEQFYPGRAYRLRVFLRQAVRLARKKGLIA